MRKRARTTSCASKYIKLGVFAGGANLEQVPEAEGMKGVAETKLAR